MSLQIKSQDNCNWDCVSLGEVMLRFDPGEDRVRNARQFRVWEGGGEYNVTRGLKRCFKFNTSVVTGLVKNDLGELLYDLMLQGGCDLSHIRWMDDDGIGRDARIGLNFVERGFGVRGARGTSDRARSAASQIAPGSVNWKKIFQEEGARWFHTGGIYAGLSEDAAQLTLEAVKAAQEAGTIVSYDLNYRPSIWKAIGGKARCQEVNRMIASHVDVMIGNEEDFSACLGYEMEGVDENLKDLDRSAYQKMIKRVIADYPNMKAVATTLREVETATKNRWSGLLYAEGNFHEATPRDLEILDRVGGGDSFASGLIYGFLSGKDPLACVEYGAAHGALAMTTAGDTSFASLSEVEALVSGGSARVAR